MEKYLVLAMQIHPLELNEIVHTLNHANAFYATGGYKPHATTLNTFVRGCLPPPMPGEHSPAWDDLIGYFSPAMNIPPKPLLVVNPTKAFLKDPMFIRRRGLAEPVLIIDGNDPDLPPAILQVCADFNVWPDLKKDLIAEIGRNYWPENATETERDWLFSRHYRLQGITREQETTAIKAYNEATNMGGWYSSVVIETDLENQLVFYDLLLKDCLNKGNFPYKYVVIQSPRHIYVFNGRDDYLRKIASELDAKHLHGAKTICTGAIPGAGPFPPHTPSLYQIPYLDLSREFKTGYDPYELDEVLTACLNAAKY